MKYPCIRKLPKGTGNMLRFYSTVSIPANAASWGCSNVFQHTYSRLQLNLFSKSLLSSANIRQFHVAANRRLFHRSQAHTIYPPPFVLNRLNTSLGSSTTRLQILLCTQLPTLLPLLTPLAHRPFPSLSPTPIYAPTNILIPVQPPNIYPFLLL